MDLFCPHCTRRVTVADDKAGQIVNCPLCAKQFMTRSLAPANPPVPKPPPTPILPPTVPTSTLPPSPSLPASSQIPAPRPSVPIPTPAPPSPPPPPGDYTRSYTVYLHGQWLPFVPPACLVLIFMLSFFSWEAPEQGGPHSLWGLCEAGKPLFWAYLTLMLLCIPLAFASLTFEKHWVAMPPQLAPFMLWKDLIVGLFLSTGFILLTYEYLDAHSNHRVSPLMLALKIAFRLHLLAILASLLMFWLRWRKLRNAPPPKCEFRW